MSDLLLESLFARCEETCASDIHLSPGAPPYLRIRGELVPLADYRAFDAETVDRLAMTLGLSTLPIGCFGSVGGMAIGVAMLGVAVAAVLKKKED